MIYLTGSNGFIGKSIYHYLIRKNIKVLKLKREYLINLPILCNEENTLIHCAWNGIYGSLRKSEEIQTSNIELTKTLIKVIKKLEINKIIAFGSQAEYGIVNKKIKENFTLKPADSYGKYKIESCNILSEFCESEKKKFIWLRLFDTYGPQDNSKWLIPYVINSALNNSSPKLSNCNQIWDYLYIDDLCNCIFKIIKSKNDKSDFYNLSSNKEIILRDIIEKIYEIIKPSSSKALYGSIINNSGLKYLCGDNNKLKKNYSWEPIIPIEKGLLKTIDFYRKLKE